MLVTLERVLEIAALARIEFTSDQLEVLHKELEGILQWVEQLSEVDTSFVEDASIVGPDQLTMEPDVVTEGNNIKAILQNAPESAFQFYFSVPKVLEGNKGE